MRRDFDPTPVYFSTMAKNLLTGTEEPGPERGPQWRHTEECSARHSAVLWGKPAVRNDRGDGGNVGIIRSPLRATVLPDYGDH